MKRNPEDLTRETFDVAIIGGGIFGACAAWDAVLRGMKVALVERVDFGGQTSANCFKMVHGGIRYMQHADIVRVRESCRERSALLRVAPHLVAPLPIAIPTYGHGMNGKEILACGMWGYDLLTLDRNRGIPDPARRIPPGGFLSRDELLSTFPGLNRDRLTGAAIFNDAQMYSPARLVLAFVKSAAERGAVVANRIEADEPVVENGRVTGLRCRDLVGGGDFVIRCKSVLNAAGGYSESLFRRWFGEERAGRRTWSRDACFVVNRRFDTPLGLAVTGQSRDSDAVMARDGRHLFIVPWRDTSLIGVWHKVHKKDPRDLQVDDAELGRWMDEINSAYPGLDIGRDEIRLWHSGLLPFGDETEDGSELSYGKRSIFIDHGREHGIGGLISLLGIRYTMGRGDAARAIDMVQEYHGKWAPRPATDHIPVAGGGFGRFDDLVDEIGRECPGIDGATARALAHNHGSAYRAVLEHGRDDPALLQPLSGTHVLGAEIVHAVRHEMAHDVADVAFRRTDLATAGHPGQKALAQCAAIVSAAGGASALAGRQEADMLANCVPAFPRSSGRMPSDPGDERAVQ